MTTIFYFPAEKESVRIRKRMRQVQIAFCNTRINVGMEKTDQVYIPKSASSLLSFWKIFDELTISDKVLTIWGNKTLWYTAFSKSHQGGHPRINTLKRYIHSHFWFPQLNTFIEDAIKACVSYFLFFSPNDNPSKATNNAFYFI